MIINTEWFPVDDPTHCPGSGRSSCWSGTYHRYRNYFLNRVIQLLGKLSTSASKHTIADVNCPRCMISSPKEELPILLYRFETKSQKC